MRIGKYRLRKPWFKYVEIPLEEELYWAIRKSIEEDIVSNALDLGENDAYCTTCRETVKVSDVEISFTDSGRKIAKGRCTKCKTKTKRLLKNR